METNNSSLTLQMAQSATTKAQQKKFADVLAERVANGEVNPIIAYAEVKGVAETFNTFLKDKRVVEAVDAECSKLGKGESAFHGGATICMTETGVRYDYSVCEDPIYNELSKQMEALNEKIKARQKFLCAIDGSTTIVIEDTGEVATIYPPAKSSSTSVRVTFKKE